LERGNFIASGASPSSPGASRSVPQFDWEYYLLMALSLALVVLGAIFILFLAM
jgi:hypothetical protein